MAMATVMVSLVMSKDLTDERAVQATIKIIDIFANCNKKKSLQNLIYDCGFDKILKGQ